MLKKGFVISLAVIGIIVMAGCGKNTAGNSSVADSGSVESATEVNNDVTEEQKETADSTEEVLTDTEEANKETAETEVSTEEENTAEPEYPYGYIEKETHPEDEEMLGKLKDMLQDDADFIGEKPDVIVDYIIDDFDGDGELEGIACTTPDYNRESVEEGWYDALYPAKLWEYDQNDDGKGYWLSEPFYEEADGYVTMKEAYIQPGVKVLEVDYFASAHDVNTSYYIIGKEENKTLGTFDNGTVTDKGVIASDHNGYIYNPEKREFEPADVY